MDIFKENGGYKVKFVTNKDEVLDMAESQIHAWLEAIGMDAASVASADGVCPVDTGRLRNSIGHAVHSDNRTVEIGTDVFYAPYQEFGTSNGVPARHYLLWGITKNQGDYKAILERYLRGNG